MLQVTIRPSDLCLAQARHFDGTNFLEFREAFKALLGRYDLSYLIDLEKLTEDQTNEFDAMGTLDNSILYEALSLNINAAARGVISTYAPQQDGLSAWKLFVASYGDPTKNSLASLLSAKYHLTWNGYDEESFDSFLRVYMEIIDELSNRGLKTPGYILAGDVLGRLPRQYSTDEATSQFHNLADLTISDIKDSVKHRIQAQPKVDLTTRHDSGMRRNKRIVVCDLETSWHAGLPVLPSKPRPVSYRNSSAIGDTSERNLAGVEDALNNTEDNLARHSSASSMVEHIPETRTGSPFTEPGSILMRSVCKSRSHLQDQSIQPPSLLDRSHFADQAPSILDRETYLLKICRALMTCGAPTHRLEEYMHRTGKVLDIPLNSFYMPSCMIISFRGKIWYSKGVHIVRAEESLNLCKLDDVHRVYKDVIHSEITVHEATRRIDDIMAQNNRYPRWLLVILYGLASACIGPVSYGARPVDLPIIFILGSLLGFMQLVLAPRSRLYRHVFEISAAILTSFIARGFGSIKMNSETSFCFSAISQACLVMILPGFTITNSALELQSKNMVSGAVRMVYGIIFILFLAFGVMIGTALYGAIDSNATSNTVCSTSRPLWWQIIFVPPFTVFYILINQGRWKHMPAMVSLSLIGWIVNHFASNRFNGNQQIAQTLGALTSGILANTYSRFVRCLAYSLLYPAIFVQVPGSLAASGSLLSGVRTADELTRNQTAPSVPMHSNSELLQAGYAMIEIAIGITVGLSVSALAVYPVRRRKGKSGIFTF